jgi:hypothetical protein
MLVPPLFILVPPPFIVPVSILLPAPLLVVVFVVVVDDESEPVPLPPSFEQLKNHKANPPKKSTRLIKIFVLNV